MLGYLAALFMNAPRRWNAEVITQRQPRPVAMMSHSSVGSSLKPAETERLNRRGLRLAQFTVAYNVVEGAVAITAGLLAGWWAPVTRRERRHNSTVGLLQLVASMIVMPLHLKRAVRPGKGELVEDDEPGRTE